MSPELYRNWKVINVQSEIEREKKTEKKIRKRNYKL